MGAFRGLSLKPLQFWSSADWIGELSKYNPLSTSRIASLRFVSQTRMEVEVRGAEGERVELYAVDGGGMTRTGWVRVGLSGDGTVTLEGTAR